MSVYHRLRVRFAEPSFDDHSDIKTHLLYNGISANSWLTPIGFGSSSERRYQAKSGPPPLLEPCRSFVTERGRLSSSLFGRKAHEVGLQELDSESVLFGKQILSDNTVTDSHVKPKSRQRCKRSVSWGPSTARLSESFSKPQSEHNMRQIPKSARELSEKYGMQRPYTVGRLARDVQHVNLKRFQQPTAKDKPSYFSVRQLIDTPKPDDEIALRNNQTKDNIENKDDFLKIRRDLENNLHDLPPGLHAHLNKTLNKNNQTKNSHSESSIRSDTPNKSRSSSVKKMQMFSLKPLMYDAELEAEKSNEVACCNNSKTCNCFTAFLASEDYIKDNNVIQNNTLPPRRDRSRSSSTSPQYYEKKSRIREIPKEYPNVDHVTMSSECS